ncbi:hypothetical protein [Serratia rubidaea]|uniref:hypothetical protein n=1 Tax=Serratia rubidaea TaxID=61652 RepID=UPI0022B8774E|nr:hypothetical protein [Serratia rubidaea]WBF47084.1 hypothetical protein OLD77_08580 [Serratia rubidaea]
MITKTELFILNTLIPKEYREAMQSSNISFLKLYERDRLDEIRELSIHIENAKHSGLNIIGGESSLEALRNLNECNIHIVAAKNELYFIKIYTKKDKERIAFTLIKRKKRPKEELNELSKKLGIRSK